MQYPANSQSSAPPAPFFDGSQACADADPALFFPAQGGSIATLRAKAICAGCAFMQPCLEYAQSPQAAIPGGYVVGIWGGTSERERRGLRRGRGRVAHPVAVAS